MSHPEGETRSFTVRCTCDRTKDTATTTVMAPEELAGLSATVTGAPSIIPSGMKNMLAMQCS